MLYEYKAIPFNKEGYIPSNISQVRTRLTTKRLRHCLKIDKGYHLRNSDDEECSFYRQSSYDRNDKFQEHVFN